MNNNMTREFPMNTMTASKTVKHRNAKPYTFDFAKKKINVRVLLPSQLTYAQQVRASVPGFRGKR